MSFSEYAEDDLATGAEGSEGGKAMVPSEGFRRTGNSGVGGFDVDDFAGDDCSNRVSAGFTSLWLNIVANHTKYTPAHPVPMLPTKAQPNPW